MNVVIIDSGIDVNQKEIVKKAININVVDGKFITSNDIIDKVGHGTAVLDIFSNTVEKMDNVDITFIKVNSSMTGYDISQLIGAIEYIDNYLECDILLLCSGTKIYNSTFEKKLKKIYNKKTTIFSAFDNNGCISYPAAFDFVIGVDVSNQCKKETIYKNGPVNIIFPNKAFRVRWLGKTNIVKGASFACSYYAAQYINSGMQNCKFNLGAEDNKKSRLIDFFEKNDNAIVFPFNKEVHSIALNEDLMIPNIINYYDIRQSGKIGLRIDKLLNHSDNSRIIKNISELIWDDDSFNLFILGHCKEIEQITSEDYRRYVIEKCRRYKKKLFSFDDLSMYDLSYVNCIYPKIDINSVPNNFGKLFITNTPVLGVFGTSSKQGKFTLQLQLRKCFLQKGYSVGQIGSEPTSALFGFDYTYPMGYQSSVYTRSTENVAVLNCFMHQCEMHNRDIIVVGSQSGTCPYNIYNLEMFTLSQVEFLLGTQPDAVVLCVNVGDDLKYITRTIKTIEGLVDCKVIAISLFPRKMSHGIEMISSYSSDKDDRFTI